MYKLFYTILYILQKTIEIVTLNHGFIGIFGCVKQFVCIKYNPFITNIYCGAFLKNAYWVCSWLSITTVPYIYMSN